MRRIFITGVSSGIGHAVAHRYLTAGEEVYGVSRRAPADLFDFERFFFTNVDLADHERTASQIATLLDELESLDLAVLNAGILGEFGDLAERSLAELKYVMEVNVWANKTVLDVLFSDGRDVRQVVAMSSAAAMVGNRGWGGYAISKAALNMLIKLYSREQPGTHFCALSPGLVDTAMQEEIAAIPRDGRYASLETLRAKRHTPDMLNPAEAAWRLTALFDQLRDLVPSGDYADARKLPVPAREG